MEKLLNIEEAAAILGVKVKTVYAWVHAKKIVHYKIGGLLKFKSRELEEWIEKSRVEILN